MNSTTQSNTSTVPQQTKGNRFLRIEQLLQSSLQPESLQIVNDSFDDSQETHFRISIVSSKFENLQDLERHKLVNQILQQEYKNGLHAILLDCKVPVKQEQVEEPQVKDKKRPTSSKSKSSKK
jgi:stress-induced morphogen